MSSDQVLVLVTGTVLVGFIVWFFWFGKKSGARATLTSSGFQEVMVLVKGGYTPDVILVEKGKPVRLNFIREDTSSCSEMVMLPDFNKSAMLPAGQTVPVEFMPDKPGAYGFQCQMGMLHGKIVVED